jgi:hypothetical protein
MIGKTIAIVAITLGVFQVAAVAQMKVDMPRITCRQWLNSDHETQTALKYWMSGYYSASTNTNVLDFTRLKKNTTKVAAYCKKHGSESLMSAIQRNAG